MSITTQAGSRPGSPVVGREVLVRRIAESAQISQKQAREMLGVTLTTIQDALQRGEAVRLSGFGTFTVRISAARSGVHPRTRQKMIIGAKERVRFSPGKELADAVVTSTREGK